MSDLLAHLAEHGIAYDRYDHAPVFTCDEAERALPTLPAAHTKNLFLRDKKGVRHWLLVTLCSKAIDMKAIADAIGADRLSLGSPERLAKHSGRDSGRRDDPRVDQRPRACRGARGRRRRLARGDHPAHPLVNTATLILSQPDVRRFLAATGHEARVIHIIGRAGTAATSG